MARVGLVRYARVALDVARAVMPRYRTRHSKHTFTQPQLVAVLCLMRYDGWTFREAEVRLGEHAELRRALRLGARVPDHTTLWRCLARLDVAVLDRVLAEVDRRFGPPRGPRGARALLLALDATGLATTGVSTFFVRREYELKGQVRERAWWLKWLVVADVRRQLILAQTAHRAPTNDSRQLPALLSAPVVQAYAQAHQIAWVVADKEFDAERNHRFIHEVLHARSAIPPRAIGHGGPPRTPYRAQMARRFPRTAYHQRVLVETLFSSLKRTQGGLAPARSEAMQIKQAHLLGASFNIARLKPAA